MDLRPLYARFLPHVRPGGLILDAGCGSGRDALAFRQAGFRVEAFDASPQMARQAALLLEQDVPVLCFEDVAWQDRFDGIWACAACCMWPRPICPMPCGACSEPCAPVA